MLPFFIIQKIPPVQDKLRKMYMDRATQITPRLLAFISSKDKVLDIGCGTGSIDKVIKAKRNPQLTLVDVQHNPLCSEYPVIIYDGKTLPFGNNQFSVSLLTAVLHHTENPMTVLDEAIRVTSDKIIIMEDVFADLLGRIATFIGDCVINWEIHSPFNNKTTKTWLKIFEKKKLKLLHTEEFNLRVAGFPFKLAIFVLTKKKKYQQVALRD